MRITAFGNNGSVLRKGFVEHKFYWTELCRKYSILRERNRFMISRQVLAMFWGLELGVGSLGIRVNQNLRTPNKFQEEKTRRGCSSHVGKDRNPISTYGDNDLHPEILILIFH